MTGRPMSPRDRQALADARNLLHAIGAGPSTDTTLTELTPDQRAERLRRRAALRTIHRADRPTGGDAA